MTEQVRARTTDLKQFFSNGADYRRNLSGIFSELESTRATVSSALGHAPDTDWINPFRELMAEATFNDRFVETVHDALVNYQPGSHPATRDGRAVASIPASLVDQALQEAGYESDGSDRSLEEDLLAILDQEQLDDYRMLVEGGVPAFQAEMLVSSDDPEVERFIDGMRLADLNQQIENWTGSENASEFDQLVRARNELIAELQGTDDHWLFDPDIVALAAQNGIGYEQADFAVTTATVDMLAAEVDGWTGHPNDPNYTALRTALHEEVDKLAGGDPEIARQIMVQLNQGAPAADALFDGVGAAYGDADITTILEMLEGRPVGPDVFDPVGAALQATLVQNVEDFTGADLDDVNLGIAAMAQENDLSYNSAIAMINMDIAAEDSEWPPGTEPFAYLDVPITSGEEAAFMLMAGEEGLFRVMETANQGDIGRWDGKLSDSDWDAVLADPTAYSNQAVAIAQFFRDNPDEWLQFDTARDGVALTNLAEGEYMVGDGDGVTSFADVQQYVTNQHLFDTLTNEVNRTDSILIDLDEDGRFDEDEFNDALTRLEASHPNFNGLTEAIEHVMEADLLDMPDNRAWYEKIGSGLYTITSLFPGTPSNIYRMMTEPGAMLGDQWSFLVGAGKGVLAIGTFVYDVSAISPAGPGFWVEYWRTGGDMTEHRGVRLVQTLPQLANAGLSLMPGTPQYNDALEQVRRQGTWDAHPGLNLGLAIVDWEGFVENPAEWLGQFAPEVLLTILTGGGGAAARIGSTGARIAAATRRFVVSASTNGLRFTTRAARNGLTRATALGIRWQDGLVRFGGHFRNQPGSIIDLWRSRPTRGALVDANFAQNNTVRGTKKFSDEGQEYFSNAAGRPIETVDDLVDALRSGAIRPDQVPVDYVIIDGQRLILNTRTSTALRRADIPQSEWWGRDKTGITAFDNVTFDDLARRQLERNDLPIEGSPRLGIDPPDMIRGGQPPDPAIVRRRYLNDQLTRSPLFGRDADGVGVSPTDIELMRQGRKPLGFESEAQFQQFSDELAQALDDAGLGDAEVGLKGTSTTFYSENPGKPFGHHWDADPDNPGDYDLNLTSESMVDTLRLLGHKPNPKYDVFTGDPVHGTFTELQAFRERWGEILGRPVNFVGYPETFPTRDRTEYIVVEPGAGSGQ